MRWNPNLLMNNSNEEISKTSKTKQYSYWLPFKHLYLLDLHYQQSPTNPIVKLLQCHLASNTKSQFKFDKPLLTKLLHFFS